jgi:hypothetical protein
MGTKVVKAKRNVTDEQLHEIAEILIGQCSKDINDAAEDIGAPGFGDWTMADCAAFDEIAFLCTRCEWWVSGDDHTDVEGAEDDGFVCSECGSE